MKRNILLFMFFVCQHASGQMPFFQSYSLLKRSESVQVNVIFQDKAGFMWYGTNRGLFRFNGIDLTHFDVADSLPDDHVTAIGQDSSGRVWTGHRNGKLAFIESNKITPFTPQEGSSTNEISDILFDRHGNLWFSTLNDGLYYYEHERLFRLDDSDGMPDLFVYDLMQDPRGNIWAGTDGGVAICNLKDGKVSVRVLDDKHGLPDNIVKKLVMDKNNIVWMGTEDAGVISYSPTTGKTAALVSEGWNFGALTDFLILDDQIWITSMQSGLIVYNKKTKQSKVYEASSGFDFKSINALVADFEGNIWIGSKSGVARTLGDQVDYVESFHPFKNTNVLALTVDSENNLWFSTGDGLFKQKIDESGKTSMERPLYYSPYQKFTAISLYTDADGYIWAGLYGEGVVRIDPFGRKMRYINKELSNGNVLSITGRDNVVWLATLGGGTKITYSGDDLDIQNIGSADGLVSDYIYQVFIDSRARVWFATDGRGAGMLDEKGFHHFEKGLKSKVVYGFAEDKQHTIWINVQGEGLYKFTGDGFSQLVTKTPLRDKNINCFSADKFGNLVIMHDLGIDIYDAVRNKVHYLGDEVGIKDKRPNLNALTTDGLGRIYVGTDKGIVRYAPLTNNVPPAPRPLISAVKVMDKPVDISSDLDFDHDENSVNIQYLGFWYQNPSNLNFQYQLENYDRDWIESHDRSATYSSLPAGEYNFKLKVSDTEDFTDAKEVSLAFVISPPFWKTRWFYVFAGAAVIVSGWYFVQYRERKLLQDKKILEQKVDERTLEIQKQAEEIRLQNQEIQSQAEEIQGINDNLEMIVLARTEELEKKNKAAEEAAFIIAHELRAPVASVLGLINLIAKADLPDDAKTIVTHMEDSADKLNVVVRNITKAIERGDQKSRVAE
ncbi:MAG TPA: two-component regulator propeller domain-containing protein [Chryseolinea sp.]|nr:two-component regulator propeller domain-containing protein [Chryseolinea sp.]